MKGEIVMSGFTLPLSKVIQELSLTTFYTPCDPEGVLISSRDVNRPGLELHGFFDYYDTTRILIIGNAENAYLTSCSDEKKAQALDAVLERKPPAVIFAREIEPCPVFLEAAKKHEIPLLGTDDITSSLVAALVSYLNVQLAPRVTRHGVLVEVYGEGIFIVGDSGVGKSETAIELVKRGHRLIADDAVEIRRVSAKTLVGSSPENIRHFIELRGIGIINIRKIFGVGAVKMTEKIDLIVNLEVWDDERAYDRMGIDRDYTEILGLKIPVLTIPVRQGRNLAVIIEVAAMNHRQKMMGYNAATELLANMGMDPNSMQAKENKIELDI